MRPLKLVPALMFALAAGACAPNVRTMGASYDGNPNAGEPVPPMATGRKVNEQDCSRPVESPTDNLSCK